MMDGPDEPIEESTTEDEFGEGDEPEGRWLVDGIG